MSVAAVLTCLLCVPVSAQGAQPPLLRKFCETGSASGKCTIPGGVAVDGASGDIYVADQVGHRIEKFSAWGDFLLAWGEEGAGGGQFGDRGPQGLAVDSAGDIYAVDWSNQRVQKFGPNGEFLLMFGGEVNRTKTEELGSIEGERNLCPIAPGDVCQAGTQGAGQGQFGAWVPGSSYIAVDRKSTATAADDVVYVGDADRVQEFDKGGLYKGDLPDPDKVVEEEGAVSSLAVDPVTGDLYLAFFRDGAPPRVKPDVHRLDSTGQEKCTIETHDPSAIAVGPAGEVYVVDGVTPSDPREVLRFDASCGGREALFNKPPFGREVPSTESENQFSIGPSLLNPTGVAASSACGIEGVDLIFANPDQGDSFVKLFGPPPRNFAAPCSPPLERAPSIDDQFVSSVSSTGATVRAKVNPHFWPTTTYQVQFATKACIEGAGWEAPCVGAQPVVPISLGGEVIDADLPTKGISLGVGQPLAADTTYEYRFVAKTHFEPGSGDEAEVRGLGGEVGLDGSAGSFHTFPPMGPAKENCPNQAFRIGAAANLPDCRAYELVSPIDKNNGDLAPAREVTDEASPEGEALTFGAYGAFADPKGAPLFGQFVSERNAIEGWSTHSINAPRTGVGLVTHEELNPRFKLFADDLCSGWLLQDTDVPLVEGEVPRDVANLYRDRGLHAGCGPEGYELLSTIFPLGYGAEGEEPLGASEYYPTIQGFSANGEISFFRASAKLNEEACDITSEQGAHAKGIYQTYLTHDGIPGVAPKLVSVLPGGEAACTHSSVGTARALNNDSIYHAVSTDGSRVYWSATSDGKHPSKTVEAGLETGTIYLRLNATQSQSALVHVTGTGTVVANKDAVSSLTAASGTGTLTSGSSEVTSLVTTVGQFTVGQPITGSGIPSGTTILAASATTLTLSQNASASGTSVAIKSKGPAPFAVGQAISGQGIPAGTTIVAVEEGSLTLSNAATETKANAPLTASSCSEPEGACTLPVSAEGEALSETKTSRYLTAAADGSVALFLTRKHLEGPPEEDIEDLYEFDLAKALAGEEATRLIAHRVKGIMGSSTDASRIYLVSYAQLEGEGVNDEPNLYLYERGGGFTLVATLGGVDADVSENGTALSAIERWPSKRNSRVSSDGMHAVFSSANPELAQAVADEYDNADVATGRPDREVYLYDAAAGEGQKALVCVSCNPSGARPSGRVVVQSAEGPVGAAARIPGWVTATHPGNALSGDGRRVFFESFEALVPRDTNGRQDVYEWELAADKAECLEEIGGELFVPVSSGCLSLISSGQGGTDSEFVDASTDGRDVFFRTNQSLLQQDPDFQDIYDAREQGGFPTPPGPKPPCEGDACQSPASPPDQPTPASAATQGSGNVVTPPPKARCPKNKHRVKKHGKTRCVAKHKRHKHRAQRGGTSK